MEMTIGRVFNSWMNGLKDSARKKYGSNVQEFFQLMYNKEVEDVDKEDLDMLLPVLVQENYTQVLKNNGLKDSTIKYKLKIVKQFIEKMNINRVFEGTNYALILDEALTTKSFKNDTTTTKKMTKENLEDLKSWFVNVRYAKGRYAYKGEIYAMLTELMYVTGARIGATFNIKWSDIRRKKDDYNQEAYVVHVYDKGEKNNQYPITDEFYYELKEKLYNGNDEGVIFKDISQRGFTNDINQFGKELGLDEDDLFTPHSIRSLAITTVYNQTLDLVKTKHFANHESVETTVGYIQNDNNFAMSGSYLLSSPDITIDDLQDLTKEELLDIISTKQDIMTYIQMNRK